MKSILPFGPTRLFSLLVVLMLSLPGLCQSIPELVFKNPTLISGSHLQDGAKYRFKNVTTGPAAMDAIVQVKGRSASDVLLTSIDSNGVGWSKAFQPTIGIPNVGANRNWWVEFEIQFVNAGTNTAKMIDTFYVTGLDIDGDGGNLSEWAEMKKAKQVQLAGNTSLVSSLLSTVIDLLDLNNDGNDYKISGPTTNYGAIDTGSASVMATYKYVKKDKITFRIGGKTGWFGGSSGQGAMRMNSLWFKQFSLGALTSLPLNLIDFNATLNKNKVDLHWITASEKNVSHFELERSTDGSNFKQIALVFAYGNTDENKSYSFADNISTVQSSIYYYRLRSVDFDGRVQYSPVRVIRLGKQDEDQKLVVYPNPASAELRISLPAAWQNKEVVLEVFNQGGQRLMSFRNGNANQTEIINVAELPNGLYFVRARSGTEKADQKFIKK